MTGLKFLDEVATGTNLGYIRVIRLGADNIAVETMMDIMKSDDIADFCEKELIVYYKIGEYWYVVYKGD